MNNFDLNELIIFGARYVMGRKTYAVFAMVEIINRYLAELNNQTIDCLIRDIERAHDKNELGMDMDKSEWLKLLVLLKTKGTE